MDWQTVREKYPHRWIVVEALDAFTEGKRRIINQMEVVEAFESDWKPAWECYKRVHHLDKSREYYMLHTKRPELEVMVVDAFRRKAVS